LKLIIQIPCYNEAAILGATLSGLPRFLPGIDEIEWLVIDDGSSDGTQQVAENAGADLVVRLEPHQGLAAAYSAGMRECLRRGADIIVNFDADGQYRAEDIPRLIEPILKSRADMVIGDRQVPGIEWFSPMKKRVHRLGCWMVSLAVGQHMPDPVSGFRALGRWAAAATALMNRYTHTMETLVQAGPFEIEIEHIEIQTNPPTRPSRLIPNVGTYVTRQVATLARTFAVCRPVTACVLALLGILPATAWLAYELPHNWLARGVRYGEQMSAISGGIVALGSLAILALYRKLSRRNEALRAQVYQQRVEAFLYTDSPSVAAQEEKLAAAATLGAVPSRES
jgi:glycosyltransferase involved in cell wall biosynthesis